MTTDGRQQLTGYPMRDYDQAIATLRQAWLTSGLSQPEIARRMGYAHHGSVTYLLNGRVEAPSRRLFDLADALGYDLALIPRDTDAPETGLSSTESAQTTPARGGDSPRPSEPICGCGRPIEGYHRTAGRLDPNGPVQPETILAVPCGHEISPREAAAVRAEGAKTSTGGDT